MSQHIAVDIGGTQIRAAMFQDESIIPSKIEKISTTGVKPALERLCDLITQIWPKDNDISAIGIAAAGATDPYQGVVISAPNITGWVNVQLRDHVQECFKVPVFLGNDANLAAIGEWKYGAGRGHHHLIYLTISTGIGGGIILEDRLLLGQQGLAGEMGHITVLPDGPVCGCGKKGHFEALASGTAIARWTRTELERGVKSSLAGEKTITSRVVAEAAQRGDQLAIGAFARAGYYLGMVLADFLHLFNPTTVILGGGVSQSGDLFLKPTKKALQSFILHPQYLENFSLTRASLGDEAGLIGALVMARSGQIR
jgi:glucokinase